MTATVGYLGPAGTFTHQGLLSLDVGEGQPFASVIAALTAVRDGTVEQAVVPFENSVEGGVSATLDNLSGPEPLMINREVDVPVQFSLVARPGTTLSEVRTVLTHPHASAQCRRWLAREIPGATIHDASSTAGAAQEVAEEGRFDAAICAAVAGDMYGLEHLVRGIADNEEATTRFVLVSRLGTPAAPTGRDKTTIVAYIYADHAGELLHILQQFAARGVNLTRLESRPTRTSLGSYCFSIDFEGHVADERVAETLKGLKRTCKKVEFLGSYPQAKPTQMPLGRGFADADFVAAQQWLDQIRGGA